MKPAVGLILTVVSAVMLSALYDRVAKPTPAEYFPTAILIGVVCGYVFSSLTDFRKR